MPLLNSSGTVRSEPVAVPGVSEDEWIHWQREDPLFNSFTWGVIASFCFSMLAFLIMFAIVVLALAPSRKGPAVCVGLIFIIVVFMGAFYFFYCSMLYLGMIYQTYLHDEPFHPDTLKYDVDLPCTILGVATSTVRNTKKNQISYLVNVSSSCCDAADAEWTLRRAVPYRSCSGFEGSVFLERYTTLREYSVGDNITCAVPLSFDGPALFEQEAHEGCSPTFAAVTVVACLWGIVVCCGSACACWNVARRRRREKSRSRLHRVSGGGFPPPTTYSPVSVDWTHAPTPGQDMSRADQTRLWEHSFGPGDAGPTGKIPARCMDTLQSVYAQADHGGTPGDDGDGERSVQAGRMVTLSSMYAAAATPGGDDGADAAGDGGGSDAVAAAKVTPGDRAPLEHGGWAPAATSGSSEQP